MTVDKLSRIETKLAATEATAQQRQRQATNKAKHAKENKFHKVLSPWLQSPSILSTGVSGVVVKAGTLVPGISLKGIAKASNWSVHTVRRHLNNRYRAERGIEPIEKCPTFIRDEQLDRYLRDNKEFFKVFAEDGRAYRLINDRAYRIGPNIYKEKYTLLSCRNLRNRCWKAFNTPIEAARAMRKNTQKQFEVARGFERPFSA
jgi:hypothetical protein